MPPDNRETLLQALESTAGQPGGLSKEQARLIIAEDRLRQISAWRADRTSKQNSRDAGLPVSPVAPPRKEWLVPAPGVDRWKIGIERHDEAAETPDIDLNSATLRQLIVRNSQAIEEAAVDLLRDEIDASAKASGANTPAEAKSSSIQSAPQSKRSLGEKHFRTLRGGKQTGLLMDGTARHKDNDKEWTRSPGGKWVQCLD